MAAVRHEQVNYAQRNFQNSFGQQPAPPDFANNQRAFQKSNLELLLEIFLMEQQKQNQELKTQTGFLNDSLIKLTSKVDSIATHNKMLETQISQVAQQVASSSKSSGIFPSEPEANPKGQMNAITLRNGRQLEDPIEKTKTNKGEKKSDKPQSEEAKVESEKPNAPPQYKPKTSFPQRLAKSNLDVQFKNFVDMLKKKIYINVPFTEALCQMSLYAKILKNILSKKRKIEDDETMTLTSECSALPYKRNCLLISKITEVSPSLV